MGRIRWQRELERLLAKLGKDLENVAADRKSAPWKGAIAFQIKRTTAASNGWLAETLRMGSPTLVSQIVLLAQKRLERYTEYLARLTKY